MKHYPFIPNMVQAITVLTVLKMMTRAQTSCGSGSLNGKIMYERLPNTQLQGFDDDIVRDTAPPFMVLEKCQDLCLRDRASNNIVRQCASFDFQPGSRISSYNGGPEYEESTCYLTREQAAPEGIGNLMLVPNSIHFTEVCITSNRPERECPNRRYIFERHPRKKLKLSGSDMKEMSASNRSECEDLCLNEFSFVCRSASFDASSRTCSLSRYTRRTHPELLEDDPSSDYLENTCLNAERRCDGLGVFIKEENKRLGGPFEVDLLTNVTLEDCQIMCVRAEKYFCRSIEYDEMTKQCSIAEEDSVSQKDDLGIASSSTHHYYDFACLDSPRGSEYPDNSVTSHLFAGKRPDTAFQRYRNSRLGGEHHSEISGRTLSECLDECLRQPSFQCRSAVYSERYRTCRLSRYNQKDGMRIIYDADYDYYENLMLGGDDDGMVKKPVDRDRPDDGYPSGPRIRPGGGRYPPSSSGGGRYPPSSSGGRYPYDDYPGRYPPSSSGGRYPPPGRYPFYGGRHPPNVRYPYDRYPYDRRPPYRPVDGVGGPYGRYPPTGRYPYYPNRHYPPPSGGGADRYDDRYPDYDYPSGDAPTARRPFRPFDHRRPSPTFPPPEPPYEDKPYGNRRPYDDDNNRPYYDRRPYNNRYPYDDRRPYDTRRPYDGRRPFADRPSYRPLSPGPDGPIYDVPEGGTPIRPPGYGCDDEAFRQAAAKQRLRKQFIRRLIAVPTLIECQRECVENPEFTCRSFNYREAVLPYEGENCELSDIDSKDMELNNPQFFDPARDYHYYERSLGRQGVDGDCLDVKQVCNEEGMEFSLITPDGFYGRIYTYGFYDRCNLRGTGGVKHVLRISGPQGYPECGTQRFGDTMTNIVVVQFTDNVQTNMDKRYNLTCLFRGPGEAKVYSDYIGAGSGSPIPIEYLPAENTLSSKVRLLILYQGRPTTTIAVGDPLTFRLEAQDGYNYVTDIFATNVVARDPYSGRSVQLIDRRGCPVDPYVFPELDRGRSGDTLEARFHAFKIPESNFLVFEATVHTCVDGCKPAFCETGRGREEPSFGKRRKRSINETNVLRIDDNTTAITHLSDPTQLNATSKNDAVNNNNDSDEEYVREMIEVFDSRNDINHDVALKALALREAVCLTMGEYKSLVGAVLFLTLTLIIVSIVAGYVYRKYWKVIKKNISIADRESERTVGGGSSASTHSNCTMYSSTRNSGFNGLTSAFSIGKSFGGFRKARGFPEINNIDLDIPNAGQGGLFEDPSEPIYTDPSLFERSRSLRSIAISTNKRKNRTNNN
ncbi:uncharacterized protein LOC108738303 [Agrilus planipennis]|uniref:Uncharacterized protein LOC108738303 n=1 Tax=Agrilus planipennis TaxID=224129 RepID=A0A7F5R860_AGRPL|nr:uncharacterized protein LOC108738303 [Agrilus planipennis]XP_025832149.1 uncharacterized protein LOC108738303 [Agrilus planipennis]